MNPGYILASEAAEDLAEILRYVQNKADQATAGRVQSVIIEKIAYLSRNPGCGHNRRDLTTESVKFFSVFSYLIVYVPGSEPLRIVAIIHGRRNVGLILTERGHWQAESCNLS